MKRTSNVLIYANSWLGDNIMALPALKIYRESNPNANISILSKPSYEKLWKMAEVADKMHPLEKGFKSIFLTARNIRQYNYEYVFIFPNSFRSALIPFLAGISVRRGFNGHFRSFMLTERAKIDRSDFVHQSREYLHLLNLDINAKLPGPPLLKIFPSDLEWANRQLSFLSREKKIAIMPGAARGISKRWPPRYFAEVGKMLIERHNARIIVLGAKGEEPICEFVSALIGERALNLCGFTDIPRLAAILSLCEFAICNDSGGMHLAAAVGKRVIAVFGLTDYKRTGPMGHGHAIVADEVKGRCRDIKPKSAEAQLVLNSILPDRVYQAAETFISQ